MEREANRYGICIIDMVSHPHIWREVLLDYVLVPWPLISTHRTFVAIVLALNIDMYGVWCYGVIAGSAVSQAITPNIKL